MGETTIKNDNSKTNTYITHESDDFERSKSRRKLKGIMQNAKKLTNKNDEGAPGDEKRRYLTEIGLNASQRRRI